MKVIHFIGSIDKTGGGTTEYMRVLSNALKSSIELIVATGLSETPISIDQVRICFFDTNFFRWFSLLNEFRFFLREERPDIVHINGIWSPENWGFQKVAQELGIKVILSPHGMLEPWILSQNVLKKKLGLFLYQKKAIASANHLHATAQIEKDSIRNLGFDNLVTIIPNGIDSTEILKSKERYGSKKMIYLSRIHPKKGIELLIEAWRNSDTSEWILEIAGNGDENYILKLTNSAQNLKNVSFVGAKYGESKWDFIRSADVLVLPTHSENFGIVVAEALAVGIPVITTTGTPWEDLNTYKCGWWINLSLVNLERSIKEVMNLPVAQIKSMGDNGKNLIADKYDINQVAKNMTKLYKKITTT
jgi:glycosyltransferase involved in cell wall biosynthesis